MATISVERSTATEGGYLTFTVSLSAPVADAVSVGYRFLHGTALEDIDFNGASDDVLVFEAGERSKTVQVYIYSDSIAEADESIVLELFDPVNADLPSGLAALRATGWILEDDDNPGNTRALFVSSPMARERDGGDRLLAFTVSLSEPFSEDTELRYETVDGSAEAGEDYVSEAGRVEFLAGQTEAVVTVQVNGDVAFEGSEDFFLAVEPVGSIASDAAGAVGRATILDDDSVEGAPVVHVEGGEHTEAGYMNFTVTLSKQSNDTVTVNYRTLSGTAAEEVDFNGGEGALTFAPGETSQRISVYTYSDSVSEVDESLVLEVYDPANAALGGGLRALRATGWILDDDNLGNTRAVFVSSPFVSEIASGDTAFAVFEISLSRPSDERIALDYETDDGLARAGRDYVGRSGTVVFEPGQTHASVRVQIKADARVEGAETFSLRLTPPLSPEIASGVAGILGTATIADSSLLGTGDDDTLVGSDGPDVIFARGGDDFVYGLDDRDILNGEGGDDALDGGNGRDRMYGGRGSDAYVVDSVRDLVEEARDRGSDTVEASLAYALGANVEDLRLTGRKDLDGAGNGLDNEIRGNRGKNELDGGKGDDRLYGGGRGDDLIGGRGQEAMEGGAGDDTFHFLSARDSSRRSSDVIRDFDRGDDLIDLSRIDADETRDGRQSFRFIGRDAFSEDARELRFRGELLQGDTDGDGDADFAVVVRDLGRMSEGDFAL